jgi:fibronectin-binding autotransporter adhesin
MKTRTKNLTTLSSIVAAVSLLAATSALGQNIYIWTNQVGGDLSTAANWNPNGVPNGNNGLGDGFQDVGRFDGQTAGPLTVTENNAGLPNTGFGSFGINLSFTPNQISSVTFTSSVVSGMAAYGLNHVLIEAGAGAVTFGNPGITDYRYELFGRPAGAIHQWLNNSTQPATIHGNVRWQAGGGAAYTLDFQGTGNWIANNYLVNDNNAGMIITVSGPGTTIWTPQGYLGNSGLNSPITINAGKLVLKAPHPRMGNQAWVNNGTFEFDAAAQAQVLSGAFSGTGTNIVKAGTLTLSSGGSTYSGDTILQGGTLVLNGAENIGVSGPLGLGGIIAFTGGTLQYSVNNVADYSARFSTVAGQAFNIDTAGQNVTYATGLASSGGTLTKSGNGTLTLAGANTYSGATTVAAGRLVIAGSAGTGAIIVADAQALGITASGTPISPATLTLGTTGGATLEFNNVNSITTAPLAAGSVTAGGTVTININSGALNPGSSYPLFTWSSGTAPAVSLGILNGFIGNLSTNGNSIQLNVVATAFKWSGANNSTWDTITANNWIQNGGPVVFANGGPTLFDDTLTANSDVTISGIVQPSSLTVNNSLTNYSITSSTGNNIGGSATISKAGSGTLTLVGGANTYTGVTTLGEGIVSVGTLANGGSPSDIGQAASGAANLVLNGGTLQYTGGAAGIDRLFTLGTSGGAIEASGAGALVLSNAASIGYLGNGPRTLTLRGSLDDANTLGAIIGNNGGATALNKSDAGRWILTGANTYSGVTTINGGVLQIGNGGASGAIGSGNIVNNGGLEFNRTGNVTVSGAISGSGSLTNNGTGTVILTANATYSGTTAINAGVLQAGNAGATGQLPSGTPIVNNGTLIYNTTGNYVSAGFFATHQGTGNVRVQRGFVKTIGQNTYTGWTQIDSGAIYQVTEGNTGNLTSSVVTNNGTLIFGRQDNDVWGYTNNIVGSGRVLKEVNNTQGGGDITLAGTNTYTGGTLIAGGGILLGDGINPGGGSIVGNVIFTNSPVGDNPRFLRFNRPDDFTFTNVISSVSTGGAGNNGRVEQNGFNAVTITGNNTYPSGTIINSGTLIVGNGGTTGSIGTGNVTDNGILVWNRSDDVTFGGVISGFGSFVKMGAGKLTLTGTNTYTGATTVSNGTLVVTSPSLGADLFLEGGSFVGGAEGVIATNAIGGSITINAGVLVVTVNTSLAASNTFYEPLGAVLANGGAIQVVRTGPALVVGQKFTLFNQPVQNGNVLTVAGGGATWVNNLATDGSITVATVAGPPTLNVAQAGNNLQFTWSGSGYKLQAQTNSLSVGISNNWGDYPGGGTSPVAVPINAANGAVFFRLISTP